MKVVRQEACCLQKILELRISHTEQSSLLSMKGSLQQFYNAHHFIPTACRFCCYSKHCSGSNNIETSVFRSHTQLQNKNLVQKNPSKSCFSLPVCQTNVSPSRIRRPESPSSSPFSFLLFVKLSNYSLVQSLDSQT